MEALFVTLLSLNMSIDFAQSILAILLGIGGLLAGLGFSFAQFKQGGNKAKDDLISTLKQEADAQKEKASRLAQEKIVMTNEHQRQISELQKDVAKLTGLYEASEKSKQEYLLILQGRNPEQQAFMETQQRFSEFLTKAVSDGSKTTLEAQKYMLETSTILQKISGIMERIEVFMKNLNEKAEKTAEFQESVKEATKKETGNILRNEV